MNKLTHVAAAFAAISILGCAGAAQAADDTMVVRLGDLNTSSQQGAEHALRRIKHAARSFCGPASREIGRRFAGKVCEKRMTNQAVAVLDAPLVSALNTAGQRIELAQAEAAAR
ncbi:UrcA family protein [Phenylobacterium sp.]|jgi:UrcA family protein|uniref:UrcA family protein n=1 Tax=Phenylobacterium sp. TaxID=1871053 RepID=UPI002F9555D0